MGNNIPWVCQICQQSTSKEIKCEFCQVFVCQACNSYPVFDEKIQKHSRGCKNCFKAHSQLDFTKNYDIFGDQNKKEVILLHGATASRLMFQAQAKELAKKGFRCITIDLPAHGTRMDESMNIENCQRVVKEAIAMCKSDDITIIGGSLGGYILMNLLGRNPQICKKAVVMMCGQDVGATRGIKASIGLYAIYKSCNLLPDYIIANNFLSMSKYNQNLNKELVYRMMRGGCFLKPCGQNMELLKSCNYRESLQKLQGKIPILFANGSEDFRDSEDIWLQAAGKNSKLLVYEKGDHFFSHDKRCYDKLIKDIAGFIDQ